jgi:hypothetical protein
MRLVLWGVDGDWQPETACRGASQRLHLRPRSCSEEQKTQVDGARCNTREIRGWGCGLMLRTGWNGAEI